MRVEFDPEADIELREAAAYYEFRKHGLGERFIKAVEATTARIAASPEQFPIVDADIRRALVRVFPYGVWFTIEKEHIRIQAVAHCHREPGYWRKRSSPPID
jgi:toxin ParE1/3/4